MTSKPQWTPASVAILIARYPDTPTDVLAKELGETVRRIYAKASHLCLRKSEAYLASEYARRIVRDTNVGCPTRFKTGQVPWNKGLRGVNFGGKKTQFQPGCMLGNAAKNYKPIGTQRITEDGYIEVKVNDGRPFKRRWRALHVVEWERVNGPMPAGHALTFRDGNKLNIALDNLELLSRAELMLRNSYHNYGPEVARVVQLRGAIQRQINRRTKNG